MKFTKLKNIKKIRFFLGLIAIVAAFTSLASWGISSPLGSSPDDNFHLPSVWCGSGEKEQICVESNDRETLSIPSVVFEAPSCFAYLPSNSSSCQNSSKTTFEKSSSETFHLNNTDHLYPPLFYSATSLFVTPNPFVSVWTIRLANSLIAVFLFTFLFLVLPQNMRHLPIWAITTTAIPLSMFIIPSNNPSSWTLIGSGIMFFALIGFYQTAGKQKILLGAISLIGTLMMAGSRADAAVYSGIILIVAMVVTAQKHDFNISALWLPIIISAISLGFFLSANQVGLASSGMGGTTNSGTSTDLLIVRNIVTVPLLWLGSFGTWGLGWLDTKMPPVTWICSVGAFVFLIILGINRLSKRTRLAGIIVLTALWVLPVYILVKSQATVGELVQPRYLLPLIIVLTGILLYRKNGTKTGPLPISISVIALISLAVANSFALHQNIRRYVTGTDVTSWNLDENVEWWWNIPISPAGDWVIGSLSFTIFLACLYAISPITKFGISLLDDINLPKGMTTTLVK